MVETEKFTAAEAAFVLREPVRTIKKSLERGPVRPMLLRREGAALRAIEWSDLFYLYAVRELSEELTPRGRVEFYEALKHRPAQQHGEVRFGRFRIEIGDLIAEVQKRTADLTALADKVEFRADGEPLFKGKDVEVHRIATLLEGGASVEQVLEDYPSLSRSDIETAKDYAKAHPKAGRPYPRLSAKRALVGAGLEALEGDDETDSNAKE